MSRNLFEIQEEYMLVLEELESYFFDNPDEDELPDWIYERLNVNKNEMGDKLSNFYLWRQQLEAEDQALKNRQAELQKKRKAKEKTIERIKVLTNDAVRLYGEVNVKSKSATPSKVVTGNDVKFTFIYKPTLVIDPISISRNYLKTAVEIKDMTEQEYKELEDYVVSRGLSIASISSAPDKVKIQATLDSGKEITGVSINKEAGHVRTS